MESESQKRSIAWERLWEQLLVPLNLMTFQSVEKTIEELATAAGVSHETIHKASTAQSEEGK